jgi:hypothetical protein
MDIEIGILGAEGGLERNMFYGHGHGCRDMADRQCCAVL